jgi:tetratricopeptide (TPR) repeat protein
MHLISARAGFKTGIRPKPLCRLRLPWQNYFLYRVIKNGRQAVHLLESRTIRLKGLVLPERDDDVRDAVPPDQATLILSTLERVLASDVFRNAPQLAKFLRFVVEETLDGRGAELKGYTIATQALGRPTDFDPQIDPIVRVEAMRLRRALDTYYATSGFRDQLRFDIPRGGYAPHFLMDYPVMADPEPADAAGDEPLPDPQPERMFAAIAVLALLLGAVLLAAYLSPGGPATRQVAARSIPGTLPTVILEPIVVEAAVSDGFSEKRFRLALSDALARFDEVHVVDRRTNSVGAQRSGIENDVYSLSVFVSPAQGDTEISVQLLKQTTGRIVWSRRFTHEADGPERDPASIIAALVAQPSGVLFADLRTRGNAAAPTECILRVFDHWADPSETTHAQARSCLERLATTHPNLAVGRALLSITYLDAYRSGYSSSEAALASAWSAARHALRLDPQSARGNQALMGALFASGDTAAALEAGARAVELNPNDSEILASFGAMLIAAGDYVAGIESLRQATRTEPVLPPRHGFYLFLAEYMQGEVSLEAQAALRAAGDGHAPGLLARAILAAEAGDALQAAEFVRALAILEPEFVVDPKRALEGRGMSVLIVERLVAGFQNAQSGVSLTVEAN